MIAENELYYDFGLTLSKNALINFILSHRGVGKTFGFKKYAINDFLKTGKQFMYVRRFKSELKTIHSFSPIFMPNFLNTNLL